MAFNRILKGLGALLFAGATVSMVAACVGKAPTQQAQLQGEVFYLNRMALPDTAQVTVSLQDVSLADAPAVTLAEELINTAGKQVPIAFTLTYDPTQVQAEHTYSVRANIKVNGNLIYTSTEHIGVKLDGTDKQPIQVRVDSVKR